MRRPLFKNPFISPLLLQVVDALTCHYLVQLLLVTQSLVIPLLPHRDLEAVLLEFDIWHYLSKIKLQFSWNQGFWKKNCVSTNIFEVDQLNFRDYTTGFLLAAKFDQNFVVLHLSAVPPSLEMIPPSIPVKLEIWFFDGARCRSSFVPFLSTSTIRIGDRFRSIWQIKPPSTSSLHLINEKLIKPRPLSNVSEIRFPYELLGLEHLPFLRHLSWRSSSQRCWHIQMWPRLHEKHTIWDLTCWIHIVKIIFHFR